MVKRREFHSCDRGWRTPIGQSLESVKSPSHVWLFAMSRNPPGSSVHGILQARLLEESSPVSLFQEIVLTQGLNLGFQYCRQILYHLKHQGSQGSLWKVFPLLQIVVRGMGVGGIFGGGRLAGRPGGCGKEDAGWGEGWMGGKHRRAMEEASKDGVQKDPGKTESQFLKPVRLIQSQPSKKTKRSHFSKNEVHPSFKGMRHSNTLFINLRAQVLTFKSTSRLVTSKCRKGWLKKNILFAKESDTT